MAPKWTPYPPPDEALRRELFTWGQQTLFQVIGNQQMTDHAIKLAVSCGETVFRQLDLQHRLALAKMSAVGVLVDDLADKDEATALALETMISSILARRSAGTKLLDLYVDCAREHSQMILDPALGDYVLFGHLTPIVGCSLEAKIMKMPPMLPKVAATHVKATELRSSDLPWFVRFKSGAAEVWAIALLTQSLDRSRAIPVEIWAPILPDIVVFVSLVNDLLSAPKEIWSQETHTYLMHDVQTKNQVSVTGTGVHGEWTFKDSVLSACRVIQEADLRIRATLQSVLENEEAQDPASQTAKDVRALKSVWEQFKADYISLHLDLPRYKLSKWLPELLEYRNSRLDF